MQDTQNKLETHMKNHNDEADWTCYGDLQAEEDCPFQSNDKPLLLSHVNESGHTSKMLHTHEVKDVPSHENQVKIQETQNNEKLRNKKCPFCNENFTSQNQVTRHRKDVHPTFKPCRNITQCQFQSECIYSHEPIPDGISRCFQCGDDFNTKHDMMMHRKSDNFEDIKTCKKFPLNQCTTAGGCMKIN